MIKAPKAVKAVTIAVAEENKNQEEKKNKTLEEKYEKLKLAAKKVFLTLWSIVLHIYCIWGRWFVF